MILTQYSYSFLLLDYEHRDYFVINVFVPHLFFNFFDLLVGLPLLGLVGVTVREVFEQQGHLFHRVQDENVVREHVVVGRGVQPLLLHPEFPLVRVFYLKFTHN